MHYLIDGHNLIAQLPDISLDDPDDEVKLTLRLKQWAAAGKKRRVTVIFDAGLPGGYSSRLSAGPVQVIFAPNNESADRLLIRRIAGLRNPAEYTLISSDREVLAAAVKRRMPTIASEQFASQLVPYQAEAGPPPAAAPAEQEDPQISAEEVEEWLQLFGPVQERPRKPVQRKAKRAKATPEKKAAKPLTPAELKKADRKLNAEELEEWLALFGDPD